MFIITTYSHFILKMQINVFNTSMISIITCMIKARNQKLNPLCFLIWNIFVHNFVSTFELSKCNGKQLDYRFCYTIPLIMNKKVGSDRINVILTIKW